MPKMHLENREASLVPVDVDVEAWSPKVELAVNFLEVEVEYGDPALALSYHQQNHCQVPPKS